MQTAVIERNVRIIPATIKSSTDYENEFRQQRVAAYCRVSTDKEEQEKSFESQKSTYTDRIEMNPRWRMAGIFADEGITGTSAKKRPGFTAMIKACHAGKIDLILTKSVSRFARNNLDCIQYIRELKELGIPIIFEKEGLNTMTLSSEMLIMLFSGISQAESESQSGNIKIGKRNSFKQGNVSICYKSFLGYEKGLDGKPQIVAEESEIVKRIFDEYLAGKSLNDIRLGLMADEILTVRGKSKWSSETIKHMLSNEKYKGDALLQKTYITDCISKKAKKNNGELPQYYVENSHPAIIDKTTFDRVQEEMARRSSKRKVKADTKTENGKYSSKFALTELLICGNCGAPYRRVTWSKNGKKKVVWRCISRLDNGTKYCKTSPTLEEYKIQDAICDAISQVAQADGTNMERLQLYMEMYFAKENGSDSTYGIKTRLCELADEWKILMEQINSTDTGVLDDMFKAISDEKAVLNGKLKEMKAEKTSKENATAIINEATILLEGLKNHPVSYNDQVVRQLIQYVKVLSADRISVH
ncbi:MAG: recombinase family protein, partial [Oscillospiraceae bacterium]